MSTALVAYDPASVALVPSRQRESVHDTLRSVSLALILMTPPPPPPPLDKPRRCPRQPRPQSRVVFERGYKVRGEVMADHLWLYPSPRLDYPTMMILAFTGVVSFYHHKGVKKPTLTMIADEKLYALLKYVE